MPEKAPAFQFYPKDFLTDEKVVGMSNTEVGIYTRLLCYCWLEGTLPLETESLAHMVRMPLKQFTKMWERSIVRSCFQVSDDGRLHHKRLDDERQKQDRYRRRQSDAVNIRWERERQRAGNTTVLPTGIPPNYSPSPSSSPISRLPSVPRARETDDEIAERAGRFLERYPELFAERRKGARCLIRPALDFQRACDVCRTWDSERLEKMAIIFLESNDEWIEKTGRTFAAFASRATWCDDRLKQWELQHGVAV